MSDTCIPTVQELILASSWTIFVTIDDFSSAPEALVQSLFTWMNTNMRKWKKIMSEAIYNDNNCSPQSNIYLNIWSPEQSFRIKRQFSRAVFIFFQRPSKFLGYFRDFFNGTNHFRGFSGFPGFSGIAGHPDKDNTLNLAHEYNVNKLKELRICNPKTVLFAFLRIRKE